MNPDDRSARPSWQTVAFHAAGSSPGAAAVSAGALVGRLPSVAHAAEGGTGLHGAELRGMYLTSKDRLAEGRFGTMFKRLPAYAPQRRPADGLAQTMVETRLPATLSQHQPAAVRRVHVHRAVHRPRHHAGHHAAESAACGPGRHRQLPDGTLRPGLGLRTRAGERSASSTIRPTGTSCCWRPNVNGVLDVPRDGNGRAIIPDPRNDENLIIVQFHKAVIQFHNKIVDYARSQGIRREWVFETARRLTRWHYQWAVIHDFLPRIRRRRARRPNRHGVQGGRRQAAGDQPELLQAHQPGRPAVHAGRVRRGGLPVRPQPHSALLRHQQTSGPRRRPIFGPDGGFNLNGGRPIPSDLVIVWKNILRIDRAPARPPRKIDTKLSMPLTTLPGSAVPPPDPTIHLAVRNNLRGKRVGLPSGQQVARAMRVTVLSNATLGLSNDPGWGGEAPLWFYILKEAELPPYNGERLGPVGGRIMAEVLVGLLQRDPNSYLYLDAGWKPAPPIAPTTGQFTFADLLKYAGAA